MGVGVTLSEYLAAPESVRVAFDKRLAEEVRAESDSNRYLAELEDDDPTPPRLPDTKLPRKGIEWDERWRKRAKRRAQHPEANAYDRDELMALDLREAWPLITGEEVPPSGRVTCPLPGHEDRNPDCGVRESNWYCFVCGQGGNVIALAALVWEIEPTGRGWFEIRERLLGAV